MTNAPPTAPVKKYRLPGVLLAFGTLVFGGGATQLVLAPLLLDGLPVLFVLSMAALLSPVLLGLVGAWRGRTVVYEDRLVARRLFGTHRIAWRDVLDLGPERTPASSRTMVLTADGRLIPLLFVGAEPAEVGFLTGLWERGRGDGWAPPTDQLVWLAENRHRARTSATIAAIGWYFASMLLLAVSVAVYGTQATSDEVPLVFQAFGFVPPLASLAGHRFTLRRRLNALDAVVQAQAPVRGQASPGTA
ncbi:hypothetical protein GCM10011583_22600 [Streptomyces camponoticapitis]|uniref:Low molecular weight protein antigen 6 PH domain-containing protein n=1 Tax=Streptomyces camponoticapitis TaxID=1616125 RepID=A0ABQ2E552_9ACTN|nr:PH domain-containing protein [Streptomyces camponoticapitis]GGJ90723.1 hypothetical protein GCM10011583_22600 [Streptomyces camponoticapitis]